MAKTKWETLRSATFRGVAFNLVDVEGTGGRRAIPRAYPKKETGWTEDNGAVLTQQQINGKLLGKDYQDKLEKLLDALNTAGPGELIHPWFGVQQVQIGKVTHRLSTEEGGIAYVSFEVSEAGERLFPKPKENTSQTTLTASQSVMDALKNGDYFKALDGLGDMVDTFLSDMESLIENLPTLPDALTEWLDRVNQFKDMAGIILAVPGEMIRDVMNLVDGIRDVVTEPPWALQVYDQLGDKWAGDRAEQAATKTLPEDVQVVPGAVHLGSVGFSSNVKPVTVSVTEDMAQNIVDFRQLVELSVLTGKADTIATMEFETSDDAVKAGDALADELSTAAETAVEDGERELWRSLRDLRFAVVNDVRVRGAQLPELRELSPTVTMPAILIAWRETGDADNRDAVVSRNRLRDPSFILPTQTIEMIK
ncbi:multidrug DMT transporter [Salmonella enterica subsp. enterica]|nr:multidrug DMT transporter [Salmonella enterica subsp. enterica serovar Tudu]